MANRQFLSLALRASQISTNQDSKKFNHINGRLAEFTALRAEIIGYQRDSLQILAFTGIIGGLVLGLATPAVMSIAYLFLFVILGTAVLMQAQRIKSTFRIGRYIQVFLEDKQSGLTHESIWDSLRKNNPEKTLRSKGVVGGIKYLLFKHDVSFKWAVTAPIIFLQIVCLVGFVCFVSSKWWALPPTLVFGLLFLAIEVKYVHFADIVDDIQQYFEIERERIQEKD